MPEKRNTKTIGVVVGKEYPFSGSQLRTLIDRFFPEIWDELSAETQQRFYQKYDLEILNWRLKDADTQTQTAH